MTSRFDITSIAKSTQIPMGVSLRKNAELDAPKSLADTRREFRENAEGLSFIDLETISSQNSKYLAIVRDISDHGIGCYFSGRQFPQISTSFKVLGKFIFKLCWVQKLNSEFSQLGFQMVHGEERVRTLINPI